MGAFWRSHALRPLGFTRLAGSAAEWMWYTGATVLAYLLDGVSAVGLVAVASVLPAAVLSPLLSWLIDRYPRHLVLTGANALRTAAVGAAAVSYYVHPSVGVLVVCTAFEGVATLLVRPATTALLPFLTHRPAELVSAQATLGAVENGGLLLGSVVGGVLLGTTTPGVTFITAAAVAALAVVASLRVPLEVTEDTAVAPGGPAQVLRQSLAGVPALLRRRAWVVTSLSLTVLFVSGGTEVLVVAIALDLLGLSEAGPGLLTACIGVGGVLGAAVMSGISGRRLGLPLVGASVLIGAPLALAAAVPVTGVVALLMVVLGGGQAVAVTASQAQLQRLVDEDRLGRALGINEAVGFLALALGAATAPLLVRHLSLDWTLVLIGLVAPAIGLLLAGPLRRVDDELEVGLAEIEALEGIPFLDPLPNVARARIAGRVGIAEFDPGEVVTWQGEFGDAFFIIDRGEVDVLVDGRSVRTLGAGDFFGELALLTDRPRTATIRAQEATTLRVLVRRDFLMVVTGHASLGEVVTTTADERRLQLPERSDGAGLAAVPLVCYLPPTAVDRLADAAETRAVVEDEVVFPRGEPADRVFVVVAGRVRQEVDGDRERTVGPGMTLAEGEALRGLTHPTTAVAAVDSELLCLPARLVRDLIAAT